jgi:hypothetical protein
VSPYRVQCGCCRVMNARSACDGFASASETHARQRTYACPRPPNSTRFSVKRNMLRTLPPDMEPSLWLRPRTSRFTLPRVLLDQKVASFWIQCASAVLRARACAQNGRMPDALNKTASNPMIQATGAQGRSSAFELLPRQHEPQCSGRPAAVTDQTCRPGCAAARL